MFIIRLLFYSLEGLMGSSFLTAINVALALYCVINFFKFFIQFGLPNHTARFMLYMVVLSGTSYFVMKPLVEFEFISPFLFMRWRALPLIVGGLGLLMQIITIIGTYSYLQQKIISRIPLMASLLVFAFFPQLVETFFVLTILASVLFLTISVGKARYQKRLFFKMSLFLGIFWIFKLINTYWFYILGELFLFPALFYFFIFEQSYGISALIEENRFKEAEE
jgi:hypothetical protein